MRDEDTFGQLGAVLSVFLFFAAGAAVWAFFQFVLFPLQFLAALINQTFLPGRGWFIASILYVAAPLGWIAFWWSVSSGERRSPLCFLGVFVLTCLVYVLVPDGVASGALPEGLKGEWVLVEETLAKKVSFVISDSYLFIVVSYYLGLVYIPFFAADVFTDRTLAEPVYKAITPVQQRTRAAPAALPPDARALYRAPTPGRY